ncbi:hypothetical protein L1065_13205, partial [Nereida sp. MMG024]|nr:hypothetical protein [Nereida sp. MMG025]
MQHNFSHAFSRYDAEMCFDDAKAENINLTLKLKIGMTQINPDGGKDTGQFPHYGRKGEKLADIRKWEAAAWKTWKTKFEKDVESFWSGAFSLKNTGFFFLVCADGELLAPHVDCSLDLQIMDNKD